MKPAELAAILVKAREAALEHKDSEDGGSCNFDHPVIFGVRAIVMVEAAKQADVMISKSKWCGRQCFDVFGFLEGQANRRTRMAEAACKVLKEAGLQAQMYYALD